MVESLENLSVGLRKDAERILRKLNLNDSLALGDLSSISKTESASYLIYRLVEWGYINAYNNNFEINYFGRAYLNSLKPDKEPTHVKLDFENKAKQEADKNLVSIN